jgi:hypothetical protein
MWSPAAGSNPAYAAATGGRGGASSGAAPQRLRWARVTWRRGTVPIRWGVQLQSGLQAEVSSFFAPLVPSISWLPCLSALIQFEFDCICPPSVYYVSSISPPHPRCNTSRAFQVYVRDEHPYLGALTYFRSVQQQHAEEAAAAAAAAGGGDDVELAPSPSPAEDQSGSSAGGGAVGAGAAGIDVPVICVNLLHMNPRKASELMLSSHFMEVRGRVHACKWLCGCVHPSSSPS